MPSWQLVAAQSKSKACQVQRPRIDLPVLSLRPHSIFYGGNRGYIGSELAGAFANFGTKITILEGSNQIIPTFEKDMVKLVENVIRWKGVDIITNAMALNSK